jgi:predicted nucleic acid-binding protein
MIAFDTDVLTEILLGKPAFTERADRIPSSEQAVPVIVVEEIFRGRLNIIRQAEAGKAKIDLERAYELFQRSLNALRHATILPYTSQAEILYQQWRQQKIRIPSHDLRIGAICVAHSAELKSRNRKDFKNIPGLTVEFWD